VIGGWLVKVLLGIVVIGVAVIELGSPFVARAQADDAAHEVANEASFRLRDDFTQDTLTAACEAEAAEHEVTVTVCDFDRETDEVVVTVEKKAYSLFLDRFDATKDWYTVDASARADRR